MHYTITNHWEHETSPSGGLATLPNQFTEDEARPAMVTYDADAGVLLITIPADENSLNGEDVEIEVRL